MINTNRDDIKTGFPKTLEELNVKYFKMMNGDSVVAYVHDTGLEDNSAIALEEPMVVTLDEEHRYCFSPWMPFSKTNIHIIDTYNIMMEDEVDNDIKAEYMNLVLSKLEFDMFEGKAHETIH